MKSSVATYVLCNKLHHHTLYQKFFEQAEEISKEYFPLYSNRFLMTTACISQGLPTSCLQTNLSSSKGFSEMHLYSWYWTIKSTTKEYNISMH